MTYKKLLPQRKEGYKSRTNIYLDRFGDVAIEVPNGSWLVIKDSEEAEFKNEVLSLYNGQNSICFITDLSEVVVSAESIKNSSYYVHSNERYNEKFFNMFVASKEDGYYD